MMQVNDQIYLLKFLSSELLFFKTLFIGITLVQHTEIFTAAAAIHCLC